MADALLVALEIEIEIVDCNTRHEADHTRAFVSPSLRLDLGGFRELQGVSFATARSDRVSNFVWGEGTAA